MPDINLKGYSGAYKTYSDVPKIWVEAPGSTEETPILVPFTYGEAVSKTVEKLDFFSGDMTVPIDEGELVTELIIQKPEELISENIAKGKTIAGIEGTHEGNSEGAPNLSESLFRYLAYTIDIKTKTFYIYHILFDVLAEETGSYDITIPNTIMGLDVVLVAEV